MTNSPPHRNHRFIKTLKERPPDGRSLTDCFLVERKNLATSARNQPYLRLLLGDRSGSMDAFVWDDAARYAGMFREGDVVRVEFRIRSRNDVAQMHVDTVEALSDKELEGVRWEDFRPGLDAAERDTLWEETRSLLMGITQPPLRALAEEILGEPGFRHAYLSAAAAKGFHHAYIGGLAKHTLCVMRLGQTVAALYPAQLNGEVLLLGAFLHDLGKLEELSPRTGGYTDEGRLLGHIQLGSRLLRDRAAALPDFPEPLLQHLDHLILSHHGQKEWGSPVLPQTLEAIVLSFLDNLDAKLAGASEWLEGERIEPGDWSSFWKGLGTALYRAPGDAVDPAVQHGSEGTLGSLEQEFLRRAEATSTAETAASPSAGDTPSSGSRSQGEFSF